MDTSTGKIYEFKDLEELYKAKKDNPNLVELKCMPKPDCPYCHGSGSIKTGKCYLPCGCCRKKIKQGSLK